MGYKMYINIIHILDRWVEELSVKEANDNDSKFAKNALIQGEQNLDSMTTFPSVDK